MATAHLLLDRDFVIGATDCRLFGAFVEHLGRCVYGGIFEPGHPDADARGFRRDVPALVRAGPQGCHGAARRAGMSGGYPDASSWSHARGEQASRDQSRIERRCGYPPRPSCAGSSPVSACPPSDDDLAATLWIPVI